MAQGDAVIVLDCGATNVRAIAVSKDGRVIAKSALPNITVAAAENPDWHEWPLSGIFARLGQCCKNIMAKLAPEQVKALAVTTFGVDGTIVDKTGTPLYSVISWKCPRTVGIQKNIHKYLDPQWLSTHSGVGHFSFNTINKLIWLKENKPELLQKAHRWLFISSLLNHQLTGKLTTDATMAGTAQLTDLHSQNFSAEILAALGLESCFFPEMVQAGGIIGQLLPESAESLGLTPGIPVISAGHDTQFAIFGSGADEGQPVLSSGTWEILMARSPQARDLSPDLFADGFTCEWDSRPGLFNPGIQWLASGVLEWIGRLFYGELTGEEKYAVMVQEAESAGQQCQGVTFNPGFMTDRHGFVAGAIEGLTIATQRGSIYRAALQALADKLKTSLGQLESTGGFKSTQLILVGGGSKNPLWNQIRADTLQLPVKILKEPETTVLGAAMFAMVGAGIYPTPEQARSAFSIEYDTVLPTIA
ncbi:L-fuculokinase [Endozoicomonas sp. ONNA2]|uniref:L-fuculokinase n=1 Tax=Endozoicomonas sp. ONNA2 TaxID=2828741 RepID=UPI002147621D|nr:L-fuculokinase [Endozoicomonas sp. ONNA2]